jgi:hypothetical protein
MVFSSLDRANGYKVEDITLFPYDSDIDKNTGGVEISDLVGKFSITESIYYLGLTMSMTIVDGVNIIEQFKLSGNEKIRIKISKFDKINQVNNEIDLIFIITEYPLFGKSKNKRFQAFTIDAVTPHIFLDGLLSLSQFMSGSPVSIIKNIMINHLKYPESKINATDSVNTLYDYLIPNILPTTAIRNILRTTCDNNLAPLVAWETLKGFNIKGYSELIEQDPYKDRIYEVTSFSDGKSYLENERYAQEIGSVLDFSSNLKMSKHEQATNGAFASNTKQYNYFTKQYEKVIFDIERHKEDIKTISPHTSFSNRFLIDNRPLNVFSESKEFLTIYNDSLSTNPVLNGRSHLHDRIKYSYLAQAEHMTHLLKLNGDLDLSSGNIINLSVPAGIYSDDLIDNYFTGKYLISTITHDFEESYTMEVKIQKDGLEESLTEQ